MTSERRIRGDEFVGDPNHGIARRLECRALRPWWLGAFVERAAPLAKHRRNCVTCGGVDTDWVGLELALGARLRRLCGIMRLLRLQRLRSCLLFLLLLLLLRRRRRRRIVVSRSAEQNGGLECGLVLLHGFDLDLAKELAVRAALASDGEFVANLGPELLHLELGEVRAPPCEVVVHA